MEYLLSTNALVKQYGQQKAVDHVSIHVKKGEIYGLIGRNGAGKTTLLKMVCGLAHPTSGEISIFDKSGREATEVMSRIGSLLENPGLYPNMTAKENLTIKCIAMGVRRSVDELLELVGLADVGSKKTKNFSLGMKQRLGIALALVSNPDLLVLDEPTNGLDPQGIVEMRAFLTKLNQEGNITMIISSHILEELSKIATKYGIIHNGVLLEELTREQLIAKGSERIELNTEDTKIACTVLDGMGITKYKVVDAETIWIMERLKDSAAITMALASNGVPVKGIGLKQEALEDYYLNLTGGGKNA